ncbi:MAG: type 1 glutamine amidotransferase [Pseudomonadota bacterium]
MRILVFQHIACEHPGIFRDFLASDGIAWDAIELDEGEAIPPLERYDALWVMGGPMDVWQTDQHPWLVREKAVIRDWVARRNMPYLGLCLGHQLLADALGGTCKPMRKPEIGVLGVELTEAARTDALFRGLAPQAKALQWHSVEVTRLPAGATVLARSPDCAVQAMRVGDRAWGVQYHVEITGETVPQWGCVPEYAKALETRLGAHALPELEAAAARELPAMAATARRLYDNFMSVVKRSAAAGASSRAGR